MARSRKSPRTVGKTGRYLSDGTDRFARPGASESDSGVCLARRQGDQMMCRCGLAWDHGDPDPPECPKKKPLTRG